MTKRRKASNWVDRGEPLEGKVARVLSYHVVLDPAEPPVTEWASAIRGMVEADASEVHVASFIGSFPQGAALPPRERRLLAIALWHIAKSGLVRAAAQRRIEEVLQGQPAPESLSSFLARAVANAPVRTQYEPPPGTPQPRRRVK